MQSGWLADLESSARIEWLTAESECVSDEVSPDLDRTVLNAGAQSDAEPTLLSESLRLRAGDEVGRYLLLSKLGAGAMGVVFRAYDPDLDRRVALKFIEGRNSSEGASSALSRSGQSRLMQEARAMAKVTHPHVVPIFDVGMVDGRVYLAMELVEGQTMKSWIREGEYSRAEMLRVMLAAGRGLAGAHEAGLVHRDFKPENVLLGKDGRVCVADFGLVRHDNLESSTERHRSGIEMMSDENIPTGTIAGTPSYMSPEQHRGELATAMSDQFSYCVSLYEAVYGILPFHGRNLKEILCSIEQEELTQPASRLKVPRWLHRIIIRGLCVDPNERYPSMRALLEDLAYDRHSVVRNLALGGLVGMSTLGALAVQEMGRESGEVQCPLRSNEIDEVWSDPIRSNLRQVFLSSGVNRAPSLWAVVDEVMQGQVRLWSKISKKVCQHYENTGRHFGPLEELQMSCLDGQFGQLQTFHELLIDADVLTINKSADVARSLQASANCLDIDQLKLQPSLPEDPRHRQEALEIRSEINKSEMMHELGKHHVVLGTYQELEKRAAAISFFPLLAEINSRAATIHFEVHNISEGIELFNRAMAYAEASHDDLTSASVASNGVFVYGVFLRNRAAVDDWVAHAHAHLYRLGNPLGPLAMLLTREGAAYGSTGRLEESATVLQEAFEISVQEYGPDHNYTLQCQGNLATTLSQLNRYQEVLRHYQQVIPGFKKNMGPDHPMLVFAMENNSRALVELGRFREGIALIRKAIDIAEKASGPDALQWWNAYFKRAFYLTKAGMNREAIQKWQRYLRMSEGATESFVILRVAAQVGLAIVLARLGQWREVDAVTKKISLEKIGSINEYGWRNTFLQLISVYLRQGKIDQAEDVFSRLEKSKASGLGPNQSLNGRAMLVSGNLSFAKGEFSIAKKYHERAYERASRFYIGKDNVNLVPFERALARSSAALGDTLEAISWMKKAIIKLHKGLPDSPQLLAGAYLQLAHQQKTAGRWKDAEESIQAAESHIVAEEMDPREIAEIVEFKSDIQLEGTR